MKYFIWVLGCAMNLSDAERIATVLDMIGYQKTENEDEASLVLTVACSVRQKAIDRINGRLKVWQKRKLKDPKFKTILTGCVLEKDRKRLLEMFDVIFEIEDLGKLPGLLGEIIAPEKTEALGRSGEYLGITPAYESSFRAYIPIMTGCNNFCSYCAVPYTRGREKSRPAEEIIEEARNLITRGFKEITFLGQNVNSYGHDLTGNQKDSRSFLELLKSLDAIDGEWRGYFYSNHPKDLSDGLLSLMPTLTHFPAYIHFPLQSGSDRILKEMNRHYTRTEYLALIKKIRKAMPAMTLTTDIIVGYPGETEADFAETLEVAKVAKYDMIFSAQYSPRPGSISAKLTDTVSIVDKKRREKELLAVVSETAKENNKVLLGRTERVLIDGQKNGKYYGRTKGYKVVEIITDQSLQIGQFIDVKIESGGAWKLLATFRG